MRNCVCVVVLFLAFVSCSLTNTKFYKLYETGFLQDNCSLFLNLIKNTYSFEDLHSFEYGEFYLKNDTLVLIPLLEGYKNYGEWHFEKYSGYSSFYWPNTSDTLLLYKKMNERYFLKKNKKIIDVTIDVYFDNDSCFHPLFRELEEVILKETKRQKQLLEARKNIDRIW